MDSRARTRGHRTENGFIVDVMRSRAKGDGDGTIRSGSCGDGRPATPPCASRRGKDARGVEVEVRRSDYDLQLHKGPASVGSHGRGRRHRRVEMVRMG